MRKSAYSPLTNPDEVQPDFYGASPRQEKSGFQEAIAASSMNSKTCAVAPENENDKGKEFLNLNDKMIVIIPSDRADENVGANGASPATLQVTPQKDSEDESTDGEKPSEDDSDGDEEKKDGDSDGDGDGDAPPAKHTPQLFDKTNNCHKKDNMS
ncbi:hypothetical protein LY76DRAFT_651738 [Colletotrichum caudatum]|nr:hypothetical protein LY76DRAFT_651738 [Colletotrichum caudatum]